MTPFSRAALIFGLSIAGIQLLALQMPLQEQSSAGAVCVLHVASEAKTQENSCPNPAGDIAK